MNATKTSNIGSYKQLQNTIVSSHVSQILNNRPQLATISSIPFKTFPKMSGSLSQSGYYGNIILVDSCITNGYDISYYNQFGDLLKNDRLL